MPAGWDSFLFDLRHAARNLLRAPAFTITAVAAIAIGAGAATAVFSVVDRILFRPLPYPSGDRLVSVGFTAPIESNDFILGADYYEWRGEHTAFDVMTSWSMTSDCGLTSERPERLTCAPVEANFLTVFGIAPSAGRNFNPDEDLPGGPKAAILTYGLWHSRFASDPNIVGRAIPLEGQPTTVVGILPPTFEMPTLNKVDLLIPQALNPAGQRRPNTGRVLRAFGRLKPGITIEQARTALAPYFARTLQFVPGPFRKEVHLGLRPLRDRQTQGARLASWTLLGAVGAVFLIGCANVANLLLARAVSRRRDLVVRAALGASRWRLIAQRLTESLVLSVAAGAAGCALAYALLRVFVAIAPDGILRLESASLDTRVLVFALATALLAGVLSGVIPAFERPGMEELTGARAAGFRRNLPGHAILAGQIAASVILVSAAALLLRSFWRLQTVDLGMRPENVFTAQLVLGEHRYPQPAGRARFFEELERRASQLPGVEAFAISDSMPPSGSMRSMIYSLIDVEGRPRAPQGTGGMAGWRAVSPAYFATLGIPIRRGRAFDEQDRDPRRNSVILSETLVRRLFPNEEALGRHVRFGGAGVWYTVVGIAGPVKNGGISVPDDPEYYMARKSGADFGRRGFLIVRSRMKATAMTAWIRTQIGALDPVLPVDVEAVAVRVSKLASRPRFNAAVLTVFAAAGLLLAAIGLYGVMKFLIAQRTREIGVRMALGATRPGIAGMVFLHAARWIAIGSALGLVGSLWLTRLLKSLLFEAPAQDLGALASAFAVLLAVTFAAALIPALRAAGIDPAEALRHE